MWCQDAFDSTVTRPLRKVLSDDSFYRAFCPGHVVVAADSMTGDLGS